MNPEERWRLLTSNIAEIIGENDLYNKIYTGETLKAYWGTSPTGKPHIGYLVPLVKIAHFLKIGFDVIILFADLHAYLDNMKTTWDLLKFRTEYYERIIKKTLELLDVDTTALKFVRGTEFQLSEKYNLDVYRMMSKVSFGEAQRAGAEVVKQSINPMMSSLAYPLLQALDEEHLGVDIQLGGIDQRKIFTLSHDYLPKIGYKKRIHLMNPMIPSFIRDPLIGTEKMSSSNASSKIDLLDTPKDVEKKLKRAYCEEGNVTDNPLLTFCKYVIFPIIELKGMKAFTITRDSQWGGDISFSNSDELEKVLYDIKLHPGDFKRGVSDFIITFLEPLREHFNTLEQLELIKNAYP